MPNAVVLQLRNLRVTYGTREGRVHAVRDVSFAIHSGEVFGLVGETGSGKSTVAMAIMNYLGVNGHARGEVLFQGQNILGMAEKELRRLRGSRVAMVYQDPMSALNPSIPVGDQIAEALMTHQAISSAGARAAAIAMMERMHIADPATNAGRYPHQLSGGMQQRVVIAMAMICGPDLLILDEPTTALDVTTEATILDLIGELKRQYHTAILFITHDLGVLAHVSDTISVMYAGELVETGPTAEVFRQPEHPYTRALMVAMPRLTGTVSASGVHPIPGRLPDLMRLPPGCIFAPRCQFAQPNCEAAPPPLAPVAPHHRTACFYAGALPPPTAGRLHHERPPQPEPRSARQFDAKSRDGADEILSARGLSVYFEDRALFGQGVFGQRAPVRAVDGVDLGLRPHEILALVGETGSGKTTLGKALAGLVPLTSGEIRFRGVPLSKLPARERGSLHKRIQFIFQNPESALNPRKRIAEILARPLLLYQLVPRSQVKERVRELLAMVQLRPEYAQRFPHELSGGEKQRIGIARAFAAEPEIIIADEPLSALDVSVQASVLQLLGELQARFGTAFVFISHDLNVVRALCERVCVMYLGNLYEIGTTDEVFLPPYHPYTEALLSAIPVPDPTLHRERVRLIGPPPSPRHPPSGCRFHTRCPRKWGSICEQQMPPAQELAPGHLIFCHRPPDLLPREDLLPVAEPATAERSEPTVTGSTTYNDRPADKL